MFNFKVNVSIFIYLFIWNFLLLKLTHSVESIFTTPDVFITSKLNQQKIMNQTEVIFYMIPMN